MRSSLSSLSLWKKKGEYDVNATTRFLNSSSHSQVQGDQCHVNSSGIYVLAVVGASQNFDSCFQLFSSLETLIKLLSVESGSALALGQLGSMRTIDTWQQNMWRKSATLKAAYSTFLRPFRMPFDQFAENNWYTVCLLLGILIFSVYLLLWKIKRRCCRRAPPKQQARKQAEQSAGKIVV